MTDVLNRRRFLGSSAVAAAAAATTAATAAATAAAVSVETLEYYELRTYQIPSAGKQRALLEYIGGALLPALNRMGLGRIGVFTSKDKADDLDVRVLIPYPTLEAFQTLTPKLAADAAYQKAAATHFAVAKRDPAYTRIHSQFMKAFAGMPKIEMPAQTAAKKPRILELRTYQSHNEDAALRKVEMFNRGEMQIMRDVGLAPVLYGQVMVGQDVPCLTYMLSGDDRATHKAHWTAFLAHPKWKEMSGMARYKGTVSKISNWFLKPATFSQI